LMIRTWENSIWICFRINSFISKWERNSSNSKWIKNFGYWLKCKFKGFFG
jgi:hypothetical protein